MEEGLHGSPFEWMDVGDEGEGFGEAKFREGGVSTHATFIARLGKARVNRVVPVVEVASKAHIL